MASLQLEPGAIYYITPLLVVGAFALLVLLWDAILRPVNKLPLLLSSVAGLGIAAAVSAVQWAGIGEGSYAIFSGRMSVDRYSLFFNLLFAGVSILVLLLSREYLDREEIDVGEYYALILFAVFGMMVLGMATDLIMIFIGIEVMSIAVYVLAAFNRSNYRCIEGALKYFILGSFATAFLLYGVAMLYGETGTTLLSAMGSQLGQAEGSALVPFGVALVLIGLGFKVAVVPFHMWAPDVYEGAATPVTVAMATGVKAAAFAATIRVIVALAPAREVLEPLIWALAALTIVIGNVAAIRQTNLKRMLAYSSVAHSGYMFAGLLAVMSGAGREAAISSLLFYLAAYVLMNIGAFGILIIIGRKEEEPLNVEDWAGLGFKYPWLGAGMTVLMVSLGGLPPTAGFFGKFYLFSAVLDAGYTWLVIVAVLASAISFYYYLRVVVYMYMFSGEERWTPRLSGLSAAAIAVAIFGTIWLGILPSGPVSVLQWARDSVRALI